MSSRAGRPKEPIMRPPDERCRTAISMKGAVLNAIAEQAIVEETTTSGLISTIMSLVLTSPIGKKLKENAKNNQRDLSQEIAELLNLLLLSMLGQSLQESAVQNQLTLAQEIERNLTLVKEQIPTEELTQLAEASGRTPSQIMAELVRTLLGSSLSQKIQDSAERNRRSFAQEVEQNLILFREHIPQQEIIKLAEDTQRRPDDMIIRLVLIGLEYYREKDLVNTNQG